MASYKFEVRGQSWNGTSWSTSGTVGGGNYLAAHDQVMRETYAALSQGRAVFDKTTGLTGRVGPYRIVLMIIEELMA